MATILIVEDEPDIRYLYRFMLEAEGYLVHEAADLAEAFAAIRRERPTALVLDVMLPDGDGWTLAEALRADPATASIPIVFLSARATYTDQAHGFELGAVEYLTKPFMPAAFVETINRVVSQTPADADDLRRQRLDTLHRLARIGTA